MKILRKILLLTAMLSTALSVSAQNRTNEISNQQPSANQDSTSVGISGGFNNNIASQPSNANSAVVAPMYCQNRTMTWSVGANTCSGTASQTNEGANRTVVSSGTNTGSVTYTCSNNNFTNQRSMTCVAPTPPTAPPPPTGQCWSYGNGSEVGAIPGTNRTPRPCNAWGM